MLLEWVNPIYLDISYQEQIQEEFEDSSEIQLKDFLKVGFSFCSYLACFCMILSAAIVSVYRRRSSGKWEKLCNTPRFTGQSGDPPTRGGACLF